MLNASMHGTIVRWSEGDVDGTCSSMYVCMIMESRRKTREVDIPFALRRWATRTWFAITIAIEHNTRASFYELLWHQFSHLIMLPRFKSFLILPLSPLLAWGTNSNFGLAFMLDFWQRSPLCSSTTELDDWIRWIYCITCIFWFVAGSPFYLFTISYTVIGIVSVIGSPPPLMSQDVRVYAHLTPLY